MEHTPKILLIGEVASRLRISVASVNRYLALRRRSEGTFPLPISVSRGKGRWLESDIDDYIESLSNVNVNDTAPVLPKPKKQREREFNERQEKAAKTLARHARNRKPK